MNYKMMSMSFCVSEHGKQLNWLFAIMIKQKASRSATIPMNQDHEYKMISMSFCGSEQEKSVVITL